MNIRILFLAIPLVFCNQTFACEPYKNSDCVQKATPEVEENKTAMESMHENMMVGYTGDADKDFVSHMMPHHTGALDMAAIELKYGKDPELRKLAKNIISSQKDEVNQLFNWQKNHDPNSNNE